MPKVSVIVPIYNVGDYLSKCLTSLVNQTLDDIQIILVNDGSTDTSGVIAKQFQEKYPEKILYLEKENGGLSDARNYGIPYAEGEYIAFLDADDFAEKETYKTMYSKAISENSDYVECDFIWEYPNNSVIDKRNYYFGKNEMLEKVRVVAWNKIIKREIIEKYDIRFPVGLRYEDVEFTYKIIPHIDRASYVDEAFIHYMQRNNSITNIQNESNKDIFAVLDNVIKYYKVEGIYDEYQNELEYIYTRYSLCSSLKRICQIPEKKLRTELTNFTWTNLNMKFPNWKKNKVLLYDDTAKNLYMRSVNKYTYNVYVFLINIYYTIKEKCYTLFHRGKERKI